MRPSCACATPANARRKKARVATYVRTITSPSLRGLLEDRRIDGRVDLDLGDVELGRLRRRLRDAAMRDLDAVDGLVVGERLAGLVAAVGITRLHEQLGGGVDVQV